MKTIVIYQSKYGSSKQYAVWIAEALQCEVETVKNVGVDTLASYDVIVHVGGLYAGRVSGFKKITKHLDFLKDKKLILCMVGMTNPVQQERYQQMFRDNVAEQYRDRVIPFALRGDQLYSKMNPIHRLMMRMPKSMAEKVPIEKRTEDDWLFIEHFGEDVYHAKKENIDEVVGYIQGFAKG